MRPIIQYQGEVYQGLRALMVGLDSLANPIWSVLGIGYTLLLVFGAVHPYWPPSSSLGKSAAGRLISAAFPAILLVGLFILRLPALGLDEQNVDEGQWIASAATLVADPRFYLSVDGTTSGPLNVYPLTLIYYSGLSLDYATLRLAGLLLVVLPVTALLWATFRLLFGLPTARLALLPVAVGFAFSNHPDSVSFNSEHFPSLLLALALYLGARLWINRLPTAGLWVLGLVLGCVPYTKLQATPSVLVLAGGVIALLIQTRRCSSLTGLIAGGLLPSIGLAIYLWRIEALDYFYQSYILTNLDYAQSGSYHRGITNWWEKLIYLIPDLYGHVSSTKFFFATLPFLIAGGLWLTWKRFPSPRQSRLFFFSLLWLLSTVYATLQPGNRFVHYQVLAYVPAFWLAGYVLALLLQRKQSAYVPLWIGLWITIPVLLPGLNRSIKSNSGITSLTTPRQPTIRPRVIALVKALSEPNDRMIVWGWYNRLHVESSLLMGTRFIPLYYPVIPSRQQAYFLGLYQRDLLVNQPKVFVDVSALRREDLQHNPERYPLIWNVLQQQYRLAGTRDSVRVFVRRN